MRQLIINGQSHKVATAGKTLLEVLRDDLDFKGAKLGCGEGECGACTVLVDGKAVCSCLELAERMQGRDIQTVEGFAQTDLGQNVTRALADAGAVQCGFCTPGFVMAAADYLQRPTPGDLETALEGNLCRCTGYAKIQAALNNVATRPQAQGETDRNLSLDDALSKLKDTQDLVPISGGTDLLVKLEHELGDHAFLDLTRIDDPEMTKVSETDDWISVGALTTWDRMINDPLISRHVPMLVDVSKEVGGAQVRNAGTLGGNLATSSPAGDSLPAFAALQAEIVLRAVGEERVLSVNDFVLGPGRTALKSGELITSIRVPKKKPGTHQVFRKVGPRKAQAISKLCLALVCEFENDKLESLRFAFGAVGPVPLTCQQTTNLLTGSELTPELYAEMREALSSELRPIDDFRSSKKYRIEVATRLLWQSLKSLVNR